MTIKKALFIMLISTCAIHAYAANIVIDNNDSPGEGLNDPNQPPHAYQISSTNTGTTLGELRMEVFMEAAKVWGEILNSNITITVGASFSDTLFCSANSATLGQAGSTGTEQGFAGSEPNVAYHIALAEGISNSNLNGGSVEINMEFNSRIDANDPECMGGKGFYYGLDNNIPDGSALFPVVLHELGHGLGFSSLLNGNTGGFNTFPENSDTFSRNLQDLATGKSWANMNNAERKASSLNEPDLVWTGAQVTADRGQHLSPAPELTINKPAPAGTFEAVLGQQSAAIPDGGITAAVVEGNSINDLTNNPADGCSQISLERGNFIGKIVLFDRSDACPAVFQAFYTQLEGAVGLLIADTTGGGLPDVSGGLSNPITIPYIGINKSEADKLRSNIGVANVGIGNSASKFVGENQGKLKMYAPAVFEPGSSVSHWSSSASPNLLMESSLGILDFADVDVTAAAFKDIGWSVNIPGGVVDVIFKDSFE